MKSVNNVRETLRQVNRNIGDSPRQLPSQCLAIKVDDDEEGEVMTQSYLLLYNFRLTISICNCDVHTHENNDDFGD